MSESENNVLHICRPEDDMTFCDADSFPLRVHYDYATTLLRRCDQYEKPVCTICATKSLEHLEWQLAENKTGLLVVLSAGTSGGVEHMKPVSKLEGAQ